MSGLCMNGASSSNYTWAPGATPKRLSGSLADFITFMYLQRIHNKYVPHYIRKMSECRAPHLSKMVGVDQI